MDSSASSLQDSKQGELKEKITQVIDTARQEGMIHSKDGKHSESSDSDAEDILDLIKQAGYRLVPELPVLSLEDIGNLEWTETPSIPDNYNADFSFIDDYPKEVIRICQAQLDDVKSRIGE